MAKNGIGISLALEADPASFNKALKSISAESRKTQTELNQIESALKHDPSNTILLEQKQKLLTKAMLDTKTAINAMRDAQVKAENDMKNGVDVNQDQYRRLQREIIKAEKSLTDLTEKSNDIKKVGDKFTSATAETKKFENSVEKAKTEVSQLGNKVTTAVDGMAIGLRRASVATLATATALAGLTVKAGVAADDINTLAKITGLTTDEIQKFSYASDIVDVSLETMTGSMAKLIRNMSTAKSGTGAAYDAFKALGVSIKNDVTGELLNSQDVFNSAVSALGDMANETERDAAAMAIFGKSAQDLNPLILGGVEALEALSESAQKSGMILSQEALDGLNKFNDSVDTLKAKTKGTGMVVAAEFADSFQGVFDTADELFKMVQQAKADGTLAEIADEVSQAVKGLITILTAAAKFVWEYRNAILAGATALIAFKTAMSLSQIVIAAIGAYKSLTAVTEGMTAAQVALNSAQKANAIGLIVSLAFAAATALGVLAISAGDAKESMAKLNAQSEEASEDYKTVQKLSDEYKELSAKTDLTNESKTRLSEIQDQLIESYGLERSGIDLVNGGYENQIDILNTLNEKQLTSAKRAAQAALNTAKANTNITGNLGLGEKLYGSTLGEIVSQNKEKAFEELIASKDYETFVKGGTDIQVYGEAEDIVKDIDDAIKWLESENYQDSRLYTDMVDKLGVYQDIVDEKMAAQKAYDEINGITNYTTNATGSFAAADAKKSANPLADKIAIQTTEISSAFQKRQEEIERALKREEISEQEYYSQTEQNLKTNNADGQKVYEEYWDKIYIGRKNLNKKVFDEQTTANDKLLDAQKKAADESQQAAEDSLKAWETGFDSIADKAKSAFDEIAQAQDDMADKLANSGELITSDGEITDIAAQTEKLKQYDVMLDRLKAAGASESFMSKVNSKELDEALDYGGKILSGNIGVYLAEYEEQQKVAAEIAKKYYAPNVDTLKTEFTDKIKSSLEEMPIVAGAIGQDTATAFVEGMRSKLAELNTSMNFMAQTAMTAKPTSVDTATQTIGNISNTPTQAQGNNTSLTVPIYLDGRKIAEQIVPHINDMAAENGGAVLTQ